MDKLITTVFSENKTDYLPYIWPEEAPPDSIASCQKCELHCQRSRVIWGEGNPHAPIIVILDNPGAREDKDGNPFICGTRQTLQSAAFQAGLKMEDLYVTYILKCRPVRRYNKEIARGTCMRYLEKQLQSQKPQIAFCMGNTAIKWFFSNIEAEVKDFRGKWHNVKGLATIVTYHPLAVRRRPNLSFQFANDWALVAQRFHELCKI